MNNELKSKPMSMSRFATLWLVECDFERIGENQIVTYEPLITKAPANARPHCSSWDITFYDATGNNELERVNCHFRACCTAPEMQFIDGIWWEIHGGEITYLQERGGWFLIRRGWKNTRHAHMMNSGWEAYRK